MSIPALGVERVISYPRAMVEPLLWLALVTGAMWLMVAFEVRDGVAARQGTLPSNLGTVAAALALVLLLNGAAALALQGQKGWASRAVAGITGIGLAISSFGLTLIDNMDPGLRHFLFWGGIATGALLVILVLTRWRIHETNLGKTGPGAFALLVVALLGAGIVVLGWVAYRAYGLGLAGGAPGAADGWDSLVPALGLMAGLFASIAAVWRRAWWTAAALLVAAVVVAEFAMLSVR